MSYHSAILVPTDLSTSAAAAYAFARRWAAAHEREVRLLYVDPVGAIFEAPPGVPNAAAEKLAAAARLLGTGGLTVTSHVRTGAPGHEILEAAEHETALIVLSLHGVVGEPHPMIGSVAGKVLRGAKTDVLVARSTMEDRAIRRILVPLDLTELESGLFDAVLREARAFEASVELLHAVDPRPDDGTRMSVDAPTGAAAEVADTELRRLAAYAEERLVPATYRVVWAPTPAQAVLRAIHETDPDLVTMGSHGRKGLSRLFLGSVAERVVQGSSRPVLVLKAHWHRSHGSRLA